MKSGDLGRSRPVELPKEGATGPLTQQLRPRAANPSQVTEPVAGP
jgi:hypothetical protein